MSLHVILPDGTSQDLTMNCDFMPLDVIDAIKHSQYLPDDDRELCVCFGAHALIPDLPMSEQGVTDLDQIQIKYRNAHNTEQPKKKICNKIPPREQYDPNMPPPPGFDTDVDALVEMGFQREACEQALRTCFFDVERAAFHLVQGYEPTKPVPYAQPQSKQKTMIEQNLAKMPPADIAYLKRLEQEFGGDFKEILQIYWAVDSEDSEEKLQKVREILSTFN